MKIVENTPDRLILGNTPWLLGLSMIAVILIFVGLGLNLVISGEILPGVMFAVVGGGLGGLAFVGFVRRTQLVLDAPGDTVTLRSRSMLGYKLREFRLSEVDSASTVKAAEFTSAWSILAVVVLVMWFTATEAPMATAPTLLPLLAVDTATAPEPASALTLLSSRAFTETAPPAAFTIWTPEGLVILASVVAKM